MTEINQTNNIIELKDENGNVIYSCEAVSYIDAIKKANEQKHSLKGVYITDGICDELLWESCFELKGLDFSGITYVDNRFRENLDNTFDSMILCDSIIDIQDIGDGSIEYYDCDIRGASLSSAFNVIIENCLLNKNTRLPYAVGCNDYTVENCEYEFDNGIRIQLSEMVVCFSGFRDELLTHNLEYVGIEVANSMTKNVNVLVVKDINSTSSKIQKAIEKGIKIVSYNDFKETFLSMGDELFEEDDY